MFEKLLVSSIQRRRTRTAKFFVGTSLIYLSVAGGAIALSVVFSSPKLADTGGVNPKEQLIVPIVTMCTYEKRSGGGNPREIQAPDHRVFRPLDDIISNLGNRQDLPLERPLPPGAKLVLGDDGAGDGTPGIPGLPGSGPGTVGPAIREPARPPDPPQPPPRTVEKVKPLLISSTVLQGKAIERAVPVYPELAKRIRLHGEVSTEVIISPEGRVESVRVVSGHPMFVPSAIDAARRWRFEPTILNGVPVRVTGVITFVFKLNE